MFAAELSRFSGKGDCVRLSLPPPKNRPPLIDFMIRHTLTLAALLVTQTCWGFEVTAGFGIERSDDLFDVSQGTTVLVSSPQAPAGGGSDARSVLGFSSGFVNPTESIFADSGAAGQTDFVEFATDSVVALGGFELWLQDDSTFNGTGNRGATSYRLLSALGASSAYTEISAGSLENNYTQAYGASNIVISDSGLNISADRFRLELTRFNSTGIRIVELDGFAIPEPTSMILLAASLLGMQTRRRSR